MKVRCFYAVIEQPGNVAACHENEIKTFSNLDDFQRWVEFTETELVPDGSTQIVVAATELVAGKEYVKYAYIGEPKGDGNDICTVYTTTDNSRCTIRGVEFPTQDLVADINGAWKQPNLELRTIEGLTSLCHMHLHMVDEI